VWNNPLKYVDPSGFDPNMSDPSSWVYDQDAAGRTVIDVGLVAEEVVVFGFSVEQPNAANPAPLLFQQV
jgi:hypothetical protein